jgi:hypothetical protein
VLVVVVAVGLATSLQTLARHLIYPALVFLGLLLVEAEESVGTTVGQQLPVMAAVEVLVEALPTVRPVAKVLQTLAGRVHLRET